MCMCTCASVCTHTWPRGLSGWCTPALGCRPSWRTPPWQLVGIQSSLLFAITLLQGYLP
jgi:hypothetical protein